jgi:putative ABC transport system substrate-binding protein
MKRRDFVRAIVGAPVIWPLAAWAQQAPPMRRIAVLAGLAADDPQARVVQSTLQQALQQLGWTERSNTRIDYRFGGANADDMRKYAAELVALTPDVIVATGGTSMGAVFQASKTIPIVFANVPDPVGSGFVETLSRPGGNATGFMQFEYSLSGKWLELLKQIEPSLRSAAVLWDPSIIVGIGQFAVIQSVASSLALEVRAINLLRDPGEVERAVAAFAGSPRGGLIVAASAQALVHRDLIVALAARYKLPTIYFQRLFVESGGLVSYGPDFMDQYRRAAGYVDRILRGEKPSNMPVQGPTKYELLVNVKAAKEIGLTIPPSLLARADGVIE